MSRTPPGEFSRILLEAAVVLALGVLLGLALNYRLVLNVLEGKAAAPAALSPTREEEALYPAPVELAEVRELADRGAVLVDARAREIYLEGHLPGARSLPLGDVEELIGSFRNEVSSDAVLVTYCSGYGCPDSFDLAVRLLREGYRDVRVFEGGFPEWRDAGLPVAEGAP